MRKFEVVSKYKDISLPKRATRYSAGYDIESACDITIPSMLTPSLIKYINKYYDPIFDDESRLLEMQEYVKSEIKPTLVSTGIKVKMSEDECLLLYNRSSNPLKRGLILANGVGVIDSDYYNNPDNEGEIFGQFINLSPTPYKIHKGDRIMQGIFQKYLVTEDDESSASRSGGFGSTD